MQKCDVTSVYSLIVMHDEVSELIHDGAFVASIWQTWYDINMTPRTKERLLNAMQNLTTPMAWISLAIDCGVLDAIRDVLATDSDVDLKFAGVGVLGNLTRVDRARNEMVRLGMIPLIVSLLTTYKEASDPYTSKISVICTLRNVAVETNLARAFTEPAVLTIILDHLKEAVCEAEEDKTFLRFILSFAYNLSTDSEAVKPLRTAAITDIIKPLLTHSEHFVRIATTLTILNSASRDAVWLFHILFRAEF